MYRCLLINISIMYVYCYISGRWYGMVAGVAAVTIPTNYTIPTVSVATNGRCMACRIHTPTHVFCTNNCYCCYCGMQFFACIFSSAQRCCCRCFWSFSVWATGIFTFCLYCTPFYTRQLHELQLLIPQSALYVSMYGCVSCGKYKWQTRALCTTCTRCRCLCDTHITCS